jgi:serine/threonine-protein kinase SRPK3
MRWLRFLGTMFGVHTHQHRLSTSGPGFEIINASLKVDEELLKHYKPSRFYPVHLGNVFESRYQVLSKLGYGSCSTVWLSRDIMFVIFRSDIPELTDLHSEQKYVALKVCISNYPSIERERAAYAHLRKILEEDTGTSRSPVLRTSLAEFDLLGVEGTHWCFVFEALTIDLVTMRASHHFDEVIFKTIAFHVFRALEFLHTRAQMVHCGASLFSVTVQVVTLNQDVCVENFCLTALDHSDFVFRSLEIPPARKVYSD